MLFGPVSVKCWLNWLIWRKIAQFQKIFLIQYKWNGKLYRIIRVEKNFYDNLMGGYTRHEIVVTVQYFPYCYTLKYTYHHHQHHNIRKLSSTISSWIPILRTLHMQPNISFKLLYIIILLYVQKECFINIT